MIDHNPHYEIETREREQGFRDATASQIRELRDDMESRYRESQLRENWSNNQSSAIDKTSHVKQDVRDYYEETGKTLERSERYRNVSRSALSESSEPFISSNESGSVGHLVGLVILIIFGIIMFRFGLTL